MVFSLARLSAFQIVQYQRIRSGRDPLTYRGCQDPFIAAAVSAHRASIFMLEEDDGYSIPALIFRPASRAYLVSPAAKPNPRSPCAPAVSRYPLPRPRPPYPRHIRYRAYRRPVLNQDGGGTRARSSTAEADSQEFLSAPRLLKFEAIERVGPRAHPWVDGSEKFRAIRPGRPALLW